MTKLVEVTALRAHKSGYAATGKVAEGDTYPVPPGVVPSLVRQELVADPAAPSAPAGEQKPKGKGKAKAEPAPADAGEEVASE